MKVLLTGASGFVGSHILDCLSAQQITTRLLLRKSSSRRFIQSHLDQVEIRDGTITEPESLDGAMKGVSHVIHCAGSVKSLGVEGFYQVNQLGTRMVVEAANRAGVKRVVHISSLAAVGPGTAATPARDTDLPRPVSEYGKSKLAGEEEVRQRCQSEFVIIRPPAIYGPRDQEFLRLFKAVQSHFLPDVGCGRQALSLVYVEDLAKVIIECLTHGGVTGGALFVANPEVTTARQFGETIAAEFGTQVWRVPVPVSLLWPACLVQELVSRITRKANVLSLQKFAELKALGWVCDASKTREDFELYCPTNLTTGVRLTTAAYRQAEWI